MQDPITTGIGLGLQGVGLIGQLFGQSEESKRREQERRNQDAIRRTLAFLAQQRQQRLAEGVTRLGKQTQGMIASSRSAALQRAAAAGRSGEGESYVLPAEAGPTHAGSEAMANFVEGTNRFYDTAGVNAQMAGLGESLQPLPEQPTLADYALPVGAALTKYGLLKPSAENIQPETPFQIQSGSDAEKSFNVQPSDVRFDFNESNINPKLRALRGFRRGSIFGYPETR